VPWSARFDDPIVLPDGRELVTLRDAGDYAPTAAIYFSPRQCPAIRSDPITHPEM
jgi:hypothetical protein